MINTPYTVTYCGITPEDPEVDIELATRPIIFDANSLRFPNEWAFQRQSNSDWKFCDLDRVECGSGSFWFDYEGPVRIIEDEQFISLAPGESWRDTICPGQLLPTDLPVGGEIRYQVEGCLFQMWNWGNKEDHAQTVLMHHNDGESYGFNAPGWTDRPLMVMPASNSLEFTIVE